MLSTLPPVAHFEPEPEPVKPVEEFSSKAKVDIRVEDNVYFVEADWLLKLISAVDFDDYESLQYFQRVLIHTGVIDALREAGIQRQPHPRQHEAHAFDAEIKLRAPARGAAIRILRTRQRRLGRHLLEIIGDRLTQFEPARQPTQQRGSPAFGLDLLPAARPVPEEQVAIRAAHSAGPAADR